MGGKSKSIVSGYKYQVLFHLGIGARMDALLGISGGGKVAWTGELTASGTITINQPNLWGGDKDQGGIVGEMDVMFGEATQQPNAYLLANLGSQVPAWRGLPTLVSKGCIWGSNNPYPQKPSILFRAIKAGWDNDTCWYPEKAEVPISAGTTLTADAAGWDYQVLPEESNPGYENLAIPTAGWTAGAQGPFAGGDLGANGNTDWPIKTVLWIRRTITVGGGYAQLLKIVVENGCVVFINGAIVGAANRVNAQFNQETTFQIPLVSGQTYEIAVKAFDELSPPGGSTFISLEVKAPGLIGMNPAHILYYARTHSELGREPTASINDASFRAAADWFYSQGFGLCAEYDPGSESVDDFIQRIEKVAGCSVNRSPVDGQWYLDVANGIYDLASLPVLTDDDVLAFSEKPTTLDSATNSLSVEFYDPQIDSTIMTPPVEAMALIDVFGRNHQDVRYREIPVSSLALRVAERDMRAFVTPTRAFELTTTRKPYSWRRNTYFRLQLAKRGIADMVCILAEIGSGTLKSGAMKLTATQDIYSLPIASFVDVEPGVDTRPPSIPVGIIAQTAFEAPYVEIVQRLSRADLAALPADVGYLMTAAKDPATSRDYTVAVSTDGGSSYADTANGPWCPTALIVEGDALGGGEPATAFTIMGGTLLAGVVAGSAALWDDEIVRVDAIDADAGTLTLGRGCADTAPQPHEANSRIWFYDGFSGEDTTEYTDGETVLTKLLTNTGVAQLDQDLATSISVDFSQRIYRPYAPGGLKINGQAYPSTLSGPLTTTWAHRDRITQADQLIDTTASDVGPESGVAYTVSYQQPPGTQIANEAGIAGTAATPYSFPSDGMVRVAVSAIRDGVDSWQAIAATFNYSTDADARILLRGEDADFAWPNAYGAPAAWIERTPLAVASSQTVGYQQGYSRDGTNHYVSGTSGIGKYDGAWSLIASNNSPFTNATLGQNHIGDCQYYGGLLYCPSEYFASCADHHGHSILVFDASDLSFVAEHALDGGHECAGLGIYGGYIWIVSYCDGSVVHRYHLSDFTYVGSLPLDRSVTKAQGIYVDATGIYISSDATPRTVYRFDLSGALVQAVQIGGIVTEAEGIDVSDGLRVLDGNGASSHVRIYNAIPSTHGFTVAGNLARMNGSGYWDLGFTPGDAGTIICYCKPNSFFNYNTLIDNAADKDYFESYTYSDGRIGWRTNFTSTAIITKADPTAMMRITLRWQKSSGNFVTTLRIDGVNNQVTVASVTPSAAFLGGGNTGNSAGDWSVEWLAYFDAVKSDAFVDAYTPP